MTKPTYYPKSDFVWLAANGDAPLIGSAVAEHNLRLLISLMDNADVSNRDWATMTLAMQEIDTPEVRDALLRAAHDIDSAVRAEALEGLARRDRELTLPLVARELQNEECAWPTFEAAKLVGDPSLIPLLQIWVGQFTESWVESAVQDAIVACGKRA